MRYQIYKTSDETAINKCLEENKLLIGKDSITFPEPGKIAFLLMDEFDADVVTEALLTQKWRKEYEEVLTELADNIQKIEWMKLYKPDEEVGRKEAGRVGNTQASYPVTAKDGIEQLTERNQLLFKRKKVLERLLSGEIKKQYEDGE